MSQPVQSQPVQREFDFPRAAKLNVLENCKTKPAFKALLKALEAMIRDHESWTVTVREICESTGYSPAAIRSIIKQAEAANLITVDRTNQSASTYAIVWETVFSLPNTEPTAPRGRRPGRSPTSGPCPCRRTPP